MFTAFAAGQAKPSSKNWTVPRTPDGKPDLQGIWTNATITPMERPANWPAKPRITDAEATAYEKSNQRRAGEAGRASRTVR